MNDSSFFEFSRDISDTPMLSTANANDTPQSHCHRQIEILYVVQNRQKICLNELETILEENQLCICDSYDIHSFIPCSNNTKSIALIIPYSLMTEYQNQKGSRKLTANFITDSALALKFKALFDVLRLFWTPQINDITRHICKAILSLIANEVQFNGKKNSNISSFYDVISYITQNLDSNLTIQSTAEKFGYSKYYFSDLFKKTYKIPFNKYVNTLRAQKALTLINNQSYSVLEAALTVGFNSEATFYRFIKQNFNSTPKKTENF